MGASSAASVISPRWPPWKTCSRDFGMSSFISLALASGMSGSSSPDTMSVRCRSSGRNGTLVHPAPARSWYRYPRDGPTRLPSCIVAPARPGFSRADPPYSVPATRSR
jgi:hypothetical protein